ncbi:MAG: tRNA (adenosine(37)-N6)-threonylcarbamoyltransferase complex dimerization subunit type 1 TsaB [Treponemataceae bacterium]
MKAIAIDSASPCLTVSAINEELYSSVVMDIGMHQSEKIIPAIQKVMEETNLKCGEIQFGSLCLGPGTFTGLRLAYAALKGIQLSYKFNIYAYDSLDVFAQPFLQLKKTVLSIIDAKKNRFYAAIYRNGKKIIDSIDANATEISKLLDQEEEIILTGPDSLYFAEIYEQIDPNQKFLVIESRNINSAFQLLKLAEKDYKNKKDGISEYSGPAYIRLSEAEENKQEENLKKHN